MKKQQVFLRYFCSDCFEPQGYWANIPLTVEGGKVIFWTPGNQAGWSGIRFELKGDRISGSATRSDERGIYRHDYSLKKLPEEKRTFAPKELIGQWVRVSGCNWWELTITEVDSQNKTFKGRYMIGRTKQEHELSNARLITEGDRLRIEFKTVNDTLHYQLAFYPNLGEYPPVLWGKLERMDGNVFYPLFRKKEQRE